MSGSKKKFKMSDKCQKVKTKITLEFDVPDDLEHVSCPEFHFSVRLLFDIKNNHHT